MAESILNLTVVKVYCMFAKGIADEQIVYVCVQLVLQAYKKDIYTCVVVQFRFHLFYIDFQFRNTCILGHLGIDTSPSSPIFAKQHSYNTFSSLITKFTTHALSIAKTCLLMRVPWKHQLFLFLLRILLCPNPSRSTSQTVQYFK